MKIPAAMIWAVRVALLAIAITGFVAGVPAAAHIFLLLSGWAPFHFWDLVALAGMACVLASLILTICALRAFRHADFRSLTAFVVAAL
jgi:hypothetical protein